MSAKLPRVRLFAFIGAEVIRFFTSIPQVVLLIGSVGSGWVMYQFQLSEVWRAIVEGILAGYIFYLFVDVFPKAEKKAGIAKKVSGEIAQVLTILQTLKNHVKEEVLKSGQNPQDQSQFFSLLQRMVGTHMPITKNMTQVKGTNPATATQPIQFIYSNLDEVLNHETFRLSKRLEALERACAIYGLADLDPELMKAVGELPAKQFVSRSIQALRHVTNTPAAFGTDFDIVEGALLKVKVALEADWKVRF